MEPKPIFINYRRDDGIDTAQLLQLRLEKMFGDGTTFLDTDSINPGDEYPLRLEKALKAAKVLIVMIGQKWKGSDPKKNKLNNPDDWVRKELEISLNDPNKMILPMFIKDASAEQAFEGLPDQLIKLKKLNNVQLRERQFKADLLTILPYVEEHLSLCDPLSDLPFDERLYRFPKLGPYKGLAYFTEADAKIFFGRGEEIRKIYSKIQNDQLLFLYGMSGTGKSSLLFAGLKPRVSFQGWKVFYFRREQSATLTKQMASYLPSQPSMGKLLIILDQAEEIITNPIRTNEVDAELMELLVGINGAIEKGCHFILGFRKEFLPDFEKLFLGFDYAKFFLEPLQTKGVLEAIQGVVQQKDVKDYYELEFANPRVPALIAQSVSVDEELHVAPLLQLLLVKMWDEVAGSTPRIFSKTLLDQVKSDSLHALVVAQINAVGNLMPKKVESGLVLDILYFLTTARSTAATRSKAELESHYRHISIADVIMELKNKYLLTDADNKQGTSVRLAHDSLAPLIRELYAQSTLPGQKASRLLDSKRLEIISGNVTEFSKHDLSVIDTGKNGMRILTLLEETVIERDRRRITEDGEKKRLLEEQQQKEHFRKELEEEKLRSVLHQLPNETNDNFIVDLKKGNCLLITGDRLVFDKTGDPLVNKLFREAKNVIGHQHTPDDDLHLVRTSDSRDQKWFIEALGRLFKDAPLPESSFLRKLSAIPFSCCLNLSFDVFLKRSFEEQGYPFKFQTFSRAPGDRRKVGPERDVPLLYNFLGSSEDPWNIPLIEESIYQQVGSIQNSQYLPDHIRSAIKRANSILVIGVNWNAWYVQSLIRWIVSDYNKYMQVFTFKNWVSVDNASFLKNMPVIGFDFSETDFVNRLYEQLSDKGQLRVPIKRQ